MDWLLMRRRLTLARAVFFRVELEFRAPHDSLVDFHTGADWLSCSTKREFGQLWIDARGFLAMSIRNRKQLG